MYQAVLSFQNSSCKLHTYLALTLVQCMNNTIPFYFSVFYSYLPQAAITVYGVVNLILSLVSVGGLIILIVVSIESKLFKKKRPLTRTMISRMSVATLEHSLMQFLFVYSLSWLMDLLISFYLLQTNPTSTIGALLHHLKQSFKT